MGTSPRHRHVATVLLIRPLRTSPERPRHVNESRLPSTTIGTKLLLTWDTGSVPCLRKKTSGVVRTLHPSSTIRVKYLPLSFRVSPTPTGVGSSPLFTVLTDPDGTLKGVEKRSYGRVSYGKVTPSVPNTLSPSTSLDP